MSKKTIPDKEDLSAVGSRAAVQAWTTMRSAPYKAKKTARLSQDALRIWAAANGYYCIFLDSPDGNPRTGIVDALLIRVNTAPDDLDISLVQLKGGGAGFKPQERTRLIGAAKRIKIGAVVAMWDRDKMAVDFLLPPASAASATDK